MNGYGAILIGVIASSIVYVAYNYLQPLPAVPQRDDTLGSSTRTGSRARGRAAGRSLRRLEMAVYINKDGTPWFSGIGSAALVQGAGDWPRSG